MNTLNSVSKKSGAKHEIAYLVLTSKQRVGSSNLPWRATYYHLFTDGFFFFFSGIRLVVRLFEVLPHLLHHPLQLSTGSLASNGLLRLKNSHLQSRFQWVVGAKPVRH